MPSDLPPGPPLDRRAAAAMDLDYDPRRFDLSTNRALACTVGLDWLAAHVSNLAIDRSGGQWWVWDQPFLVIGRSDTLQHAIALAIVRVGEAQGR